MQPKQNKNQKKKGAKTDSRQQNSALLGLLKKNIVYFVFVILNYSLHLVTKAPRDGGDKSACFIVVEP